MPRELWMQPSLKRLVPLEDLLVCHGVVHIDRIEREAGRNPRFRHLLGDVWQNAMADEVWARVQASHERRGWDGIPGWNRAPIHHQPSQVDNRIEWLFSPTRFFSFAG